MPVFCVEALSRGLGYTRPEIFNTDQGVQFTSRQFVEKLESKDIRVSMDGKGRALDNVFVERLWRSVKYENIYLNDYASLEEVRKGLREYFKYYNEKRPHQGLGYRTPAELYFGSKNQVLPRELPHGGAGIAPSDGIEYDAPKTDER